MSQLRTPYKYIHILGQVALNDLWFYKWLEEWQCSREVTVMQQVQVSPWLLAGLVLHSPELKSAAALANSQLVPLLPVGILHLVIWIICFISRKSPIREEENYAFIVMVTWQLQRSLLLGNQSRHNMHAP